MVFICDMYVDRPFFTSCLYAHAAMNCAVMVSYWREINTEFKLFVRLCDTIDPYELPSPLYSLFVFMKSLVDILRISERHEINNTALKKKDVLFSVASCDYPSNLLAKGSRCDLAELR
jgi:hypothetical protein